VPGGRGVAAGGVFAATPRSACGSELAGAAMAADPAVMGLGMAAGRGAGAARVGTPADGIPAVSRDVGLLPGGGAGVRTAPPAGGGGGGTARTGGPAGAGVIAGRIGTAVGDRVAGRVPGAA